MTVSFPAEMPATRSRGRGVWVTLEPWVFIVDGLTATIPDGFLCDLYSVPWPLTLFFPRDESDNRPALIHDWLYATVGLRAFDGAASKLSRAQCDRALLVAARQCGLPERRCLSIYSGVRIGGWVPWGRLERAGYSVARPCFGRL